MAGVLGIDAAWTAKEPSGIALLEGSPGEWRCVTVTPSYGSFLALAEGVPVDWVAKAKGAVPEASQLIAAAERLLGGGEVAAVTVDMPLATVPITGRRKADSAISRVYGGRGASVHSLSAERPGIISDQLSRDFTAAGFPLATSTTPVGTPNRRVEVYPHPALIILTEASYRLPYKVSRSRKYWPDRTPTLCTHPILLEHFSTTVYVAWWLPNARYQMLLLPTLPNGCTRTCSQENDWALAYWPPEGTSWKSILTLQA